MVKFLRAVLCAMLVLVGLVAAAPAASAAPPTSPHTGTADAGVAEVDLTFAGDPTFADARFANSQARLAVPGDPPSVAFSSNLLITVPGLDIQRERRRQDAPPDNTEPAVDSLASVTADGVTTGVIETSNLARFADDAAACLPGGAAAARSLTTTTGLGLSPAAAPNLLATGAGSVEATVGLTPSRAGGLNRQVESVAVGTLGDISLFDGEVGIAVADGATLTASADGTDGGAGVDYDAPAVTVTFDGAQTTVALGVSTPFDLGPLGELVVTVNEPSTTVDPQGLSAEASVFAVTLAVQVGPDGNTDGTATIDLLPLSVTAAVPAGGIDCPPPAPVIVSPADGAVTRDTTPTYRGTGTPGASIDLTVDGVLREDVAVVDDDGNWRYTEPGPGLADGPHTVLARQSVNDVSSADSATNDFLVDGTAPARPVVTDPEDGDVLNDDTPTITGTGEPGATVTVTIDGEEVGEATVDGDGAWSLTLDEALDDGAHTIGAVQADAAGNASPGAAEVAVVVDTEAAPPVITNPEDGSVVRDRTPTIEGRAEPGAEVVVSVDGEVVGTVTADRDGRFALTLTGPLGEGDHVVSAVQTDEAGNVSEPGEVEFAVDTEAPAAPVVTSPEDGATVTDRTPTIAGTGEPGTTVAVFVDGEPVGVTEVDEDGRWRLTLDGPLPDGVYTITAVAVDDAGNESRVAAAVEIRIDGPAVLDPADGPELADTGGPGLGYLVVGGVLLAVGGTVLSLTRRKA